MHALIAAFRVSLRRSRADWPIVAAAWLVTLLAAALVAAGPVYWVAASSAGLGRTVADAPAGDTSIDVSLYGTPSHVADIDGSMVADLRQAIATVGGSVLREVRSSATLTIASRPSIRAGDLATLGSLDGLADHATLIDGSWPADRAGASGPIEVAVVDAVASELRLAVGDELSLVTQEGNAATVQVRLAGIFAIDSVVDPFWHGDEQLTSGIVDGEGFRTFGPFLATSNDLLLHIPIVSVHAWWRAFPDLARLSVDDVASLRGALEGLPDRLRIDTGEAPYIATGLPTLLGDAERSMLVSRTNMLVLMAQLAILAIYAIILIASLLVDHRRVDTSLLLSRGAEPLQVASLALMEGLMLAIPAVILGPWLAVAAVAVLGIAGPLADIGLSLQPRVTVDGYVFAGAIAGVCVALLVLPAFLAARSFAAEQRGLSRQETRTFGQRMGLDIALLAISGIGLWQLRLYGAPLTRTVQGSLGLDPLLVAAPAISLLAGGVLALRVLPLLAQGVEAAVSRRRDLVASLGTRQLARRPLRYTRSALMLMIAISMGVFAVSYAATWSGSQRDQAAYQAGADVRVVPGHALGALPAWALPGEYAGLAGVEQLSPVERIANGVSFAAGAGDLLGIDAQTAAGITLLREDQAAQPLGDLMQALRDGRPEPSLVPLPAGTAYLRISPLLDLTSVGRFVFDPGTGAGHVERLDPASLTDLKVSVNALVRDAAGLLYRVESDPTPVNGPDTTIVVPLEPVAVHSAPIVDEVGARLDGPIELAGVGITVWLPNDLIVNVALVGVAGVSAGHDPAGPWAVVHLDDNGPWSAQMAAGLRPLVAVPAGRTRGTAVQITNEDQQNTLFGNGGGQVAARLMFLPSSITSVTGAMPVIANRAFLAATASATDDTITLSVDGVSRRVSIAGVVDTFPTTDPDRPLLIVDEPTLGLLRLQANGIARSADEWWMQVAAGRQDALAAALRDSPFDSAQVVSAVDRSRSLSTDPVAIGIIGALALGFVATGLFAIVGLTVSAAVSARERRTEFALLRALGLSGRQLSSWLWLENGSLVLVGLLTGTGLGLLIGWIVLPFVTVTQRATAPVPPVIVQLPWDRILLLDVASALALGVAVVAIGSVLRRLGVGSVLRMGED